MKLINSGRLDRAVLGLRAPKALPTLAPISKAHPRVFKTLLALLAMSFEALIPFLTRFLKNSLNSFASNVLALTVIDFFLLQIEQKTINTLLI